MKTFQKISLLVFVSAFGYNQAFAQLKVFSGGNVVVGATTTPLQTLDVQGRMNVENGVIQKGGSAITTGTDLGLYSLTSSSFLRFVTNSGNIQFFADGGTTPTGGTPLMHIDNTGNIGIGTTIPIQLLDVQGRMNLRDGVIQRGGSAITSGTDLGLYSLTSTNFIRFVTNAGPIRFYSDGGTTPVGGTATVSIESDGKVGVGTTTPATMLEILQPNGVAFGTVIQMRTTSGTDAPRAAFEYYNGGSPKRWNVGIRNNATAFGIFEDGYSGSFGTERITVLAGGKVGIGTTSPSDMLTVAGNTVPSADNLYTCGKSGQRWSAVWAVNGTIQTSDARCKTNVTDLKYGLKEIMKLRPVTYNWKEHDNGKRIGLIAQELQTVIGEVVITGDDENKNLGVIYTELIPVLIKGMQEQQQMISDLKNEVGDLRNDTNQAPAALTGINSNPAKLSQNKPNLFNEQTIIEYYLPAETKTASLMIFDIQGKLIKTIAVTSFGNASVIINANELSPGMFIYSLIADGREIDSKRMILTQ